MRAEDKQRSQPLVVGRYVLHDAIATGGMATVHLGRLLGAGGFARTVAIKRLHPHLATDPEFVSMLLDEAKLATRIRHPNVAQTLDVVALEGELLLVMDYVEGESLARLLRAAQGAIPVPLVAGILVGILEGLHAGHEATNDAGEPMCVVHRDVSPQNVIVGIDGVPRMIDFGVAKAIGQSRTTKNGQIKGKLAYMAPEQVRAGKLTCRTDIFSASIVFWETLTQKRLFSGTDEGDTLFQVLEKAIPRPSTVAPGVPPELDSIVARGLARNPDKRYPTARDMAAAIEAATPLASAREIGAWVRETAREALELRKTQILHLAQSPTVQRDDPAAPPSRRDQRPTITDVRKPKAPSATDGGAALESTSSPPSAVTAEAISMGVSRAPPSSSRGGQLAFAAVFAAGAIALSLWFMRAPSSPTPAARAPIAPPTASAPPIPAASASASGAAAPEPTAASLSESPEPHEEARPATAASARPSGHPRSSKPLAPLYGRD